MCGSVTPDMENKIIKQTEDSCVPSFAANDVENQLFLSKSTPTPRTDYKMLGWVRFLSLRKKDVWLTENTGEVGLDETALNCFHGRVPVQFFFSKNHCLLELWVRRSCKRLTCKK